MAVGLFPPKAKISGGKSPPPKEAKISALLVWGGGSPTCDLACKYHVTKINIIFNVFIYVFTYVFIYVLYF